MSYVRVTTATSWVRRTSWSGRTQRLKPTSNIDFEGGLTPGPSISEGWIQEISWAMAASHRPWSWTPFEHHWLVSYKEIKNIEFDLIILLANPNSFHTSTRAYMLPRRSVGAAMEGPIPLLSFEWPSTIFFQLCIPSGELYERTNLLW